MREQRPVVKEGTRRRENEVQRSKSPNGEAREAGGEEGERLKEWRENGASCRRRRRRFWLRTGGGEDGRARSVLPWQLLSERAEIVGRVEDERTSCGTGPQCVAEVAQRAGRELEKAGVTGKRAERELEELAWLVSREVQKESLEDTKGEERAAPCPLRVAPAKSWKS